MKATNNGELTYIPRCDIVIPYSGGNYVIPMRVLPDITDSHAFSYNNETIGGRSFPIKTASHGEDRTISMKVHFVILRSTDAQLNLRHLRALQGATYPREIPQHPYVPPPVCKIRCGSLLAGEETAGYLCAVLRSCSVSHQTDVAWYHTESDFSYVPYKMDVDLQWEVVYSSNKLPGQDKIMRDI